MKDLPEKLDVIQQWIEKAEHDLKNAEHTLTLKEDCPCDTACFHAQQGVEKYLKALLTFHEVDFPKTHDLTELVVLIPKPDRDEIDVPDLSDLNPYAVESRYPGDWDSVGREEAERAIEVAQKICQKIRSKLQID